MISAGVDSGMETTKVVILDEKGEYASAVVAGGLRSAAEVAESAYEEALRKAGCAASEVACTIATGSGSAFIPFADQEQPEFICLAKGIDLLLPSTRTLLDLGARKSLVVRCSAGMPIKMLTSGTCAGGTGSTIEMAAGILNLELNELDALFFKSTAEVEILSTCLVFAESEIISLVHGGTLPEDIVRGVFRGLAGRVGSQLMEVGLENHVAIVGGVAKSKAMAVALEERLGTKILAPRDAEIVGALGAALIAQERIVGL